MLWIIARSFAHHAIKQTSQVCSSLQTLHTMLERGAGKKKNTSLHSTLFIRLPHITPASRHAPVSPTVRSASPPPSHLSDCEHAPPLVFTALHRNELPSNLGSDPTGPHVNSFTESRFHASLFLLSFSFLHLPQRFIICLTIISSYPPTSFL